MAVSWGMRWAWGRPARYAAVEGAQFTSTQLVVIFTRSLQQCLLLPRVGMQKVTWEELAVFELLFPVWVFKNCATTMV